MKVCTLLWNPGLHISDSNYTTAMNQAVRTHWDKLVQLTQTKAECQATLEAEHKVSLQLIHSSIHSKKNKLPHLKPGLRRQTTPTQQLYPLHSSIRKQHLSFCRLFVSLHGSLFYSSLSSLPLLCWPHSHTRHSLSRIMHSLCDTLCQETPAVDWLPCDSASQPAGGSPAHIASHLS